MPNHVVNEIIIEGDDALLDRVLAKVSSAERPIDFEVLLPTPLNSWRYGQSTKHEKAFPIMEMDWTRENWGTKWNAYGIDDDYQSIVRADGRLTLTFQTAWGPPMGWLLALHNSLGLAFTYGHLSEGGSAARVGWFKAAPTDNDFAELWDETDASTEQTRHLHKLLWGVEEFPVEEEA